MYVSICYSSGDNVLVLCRIGDALEVVQSVRETVQPRIEFQNVLKEFETEEANNWELKDYSEY